MIGKFYAIKDEKSINTGTVISTLFACVVAGGSYFLGGFGRLFDSSEIYDETGSVVFDSIVPHMPVSYTHLDQCGGAFFRASPHFQLRYRKQTENLHWFSRYDDEKYGETRRGCVSGFGRGY